MRLYNKTPQEIWADVPLPYRIILVAGAVFILFSVLFLLVMSFKKVATIGSAGKGAIAIVGDNTGNFFDPSIASDGKNTTAMVYTNAGSVNNTKINLALASESCDRWRQHGTIFSERKESLLAPDGLSTLIDGYVRYETPSLAYDPQDRAAPWKVFAYRYFWMGDAGFAQRYSMVVMRTATTLDGPWSKEEWLFSAAPDFPPPPYQNLIHVHLNQTSPDLAGITSYSRPSVVEDRGVLLMSLAAFKGIGEIDRVILLISPDHGNRWVYAGTLMTREQARKVGNFTRISGASLLKQGQAFYLAAALGNDEINANGTYLFRIVDPAKAKLLSNDAGIPAVVRQIPLQSQAPTVMGGGYAAYNDNCQSGIITSEYSGLRNSFQLFNTLETPAEK